MDAFASWQKFLHPETLKTNLIAASVYIVAWDALCDCIIEQVKDFYLLGFDEESDCPAYQELLAKDKSKLRASLLWFKESGVVDDADFDLVDRLRQHRNEIAHHLQEFIAGQRQVEPALVEQLCVLVCKIDKWWICNIEVPCNPDFSGKDIDYDGVMSGRMMFLHMLFQTALGSEEDANKFYVNLMAQAKERGLAS